MAIMAMGTRTRVLLALTPFILTSFSGFSGDWNFKPSANLKETYSDNLELSNATKKSGLVSQTGVDVSANYKSQNASLDLKSTSTYAWYSHNHDADNDYHTVAASSRVLLGLKGLNWISNISIKNEQRNSARNALGGIVSGDVTQTENYSTGLQYTVNNSRYSLQTSGIYRHNSADDRVGESNGVSVNLNTQNGSAAKNVFWNINTNYSKRKNNNRDSEQHIIELKVGLITDYKFIPFFRYYDEDNTGNIQRNTSTNTNSYGVGFRWLPIPRLYIDLSYNQPSDDSLDSNNEEQGAYADILLNWQPTSRTQIELSHSQRFFGDSYGLNLKHKNRRLTNTLTYNEEIQSFTRDNFQAVTTSFLCQNPNATSLSDCFAQIGDQFSVSNSQVISVTSLELIEDNDYSLNKSLRWSSTLALPRTKFSINIGLSNRESLNTGNENETTRAGLKISRNISPRSTLSISTDFNERTFNKNSTSNQVDKYRRYTLDLSRKFNQSLACDFDISHINKTSSNSNFNFKENRISLHLTKDF